MFLSPSSSPVMTRLRVLAGSSLSSLEDISNKINTGNTHDVISDAFEGRLCMYIKGFTDPDNPTPDSEFFQREDRPGITWSIQVQGRFLQPHSADDILFGNVFERSLNLPWGSNAALSFMKYMDPTLDQHLTSQHKPWALSPLISTMPYLSHSHVPNLKGISDFPPFPQHTSITDDVSQLSQAVSPETAASNDEPAAQLMKVHTSSERRAYFRNQVARSQISFGPEDVLTTDFCYGFLELDHGLVVRLPGGLSFSITKYWDGQPVRFICCERQKTMEDENEQDPWGRVFWCISIERGEETANGHAEQVD